MREFFLNLLENLDKLAGLRQLEKIYAAHGEDLESARNEIKVLLDVLCRVSKQFPEIPEDDQQKIITQAVISTSREEFTSLNGNVLWGWLNKQKPRYFKQSHHQEVEEKKAEPLTGEARQKALEKWLNSLANAEQRLIAQKKVDAKTEGKEWVSELERKAVSATIDPERHIYTLEELKARNERIRALQEKSFRERNPGASEEEVKLFLESVKRYEIKIPD